MREFTSSVSEKQKKYNFPLVIFKINPDRRYRMNYDIKRDLGEQPIAGIISEKNLKSHDIVNASTEQITYKMISRAVKGRRLLPKVQNKILRAINSLTENQYSLKDIFNY